MGLEQWQPWAACSGMDPNIFHPERGQTGAEGMEIEATRVCGGCPVRAPCLDEHLHEELGIWGGWKMTVREFVRRNPHDCPVCGTPLPALHPTLFCSDGCLESVWPTPEREVFIDDLVELAERLDGMEARAKRWNHDRKAGRVTDEAAVCA